MFKSILKSRNINFKNQYFYSSSTTTYPNATQSFHNKIQSINKNIQFSHLSNQWSASRLGINVDDLNLIESDHRATLITAFKNGCNVVHSHNNDSKLATDVLSSIVGVNENDNENEKDKNVIIKRSELIYIQRTRPLPSSTTLFEPNDIRRFVTDQLKTSLERMSTSQLDVLLLDISSSIITSTNIESTLQQIKYSLDAMEHLVNEGKLRSYGLSLNNLVPTTRESTAIIEKLLFNQNQQFPYLQFIEFPFNLCQHQSLSLLNFESQNSLIGFAKKHNLTTINSSPSYFTHPTTGKLSRFATVQSHKDRDLQNLLKEAFDLAIHLEIINPIFKDSVQAEMIKRTPDIIGQLRWAHHLVYDSQKHEKLSNYWSWQRLLSAKIRPQVNEAIMSIFSNHIMNSWGGGYRKAIDNLFNLYGNSLEASLFEQQSALAKSVSHSLSLPENQSHSLNLIKLAHNISNSAKIDISIDTFTSPSEIKSILTEPNQIYTNNQQPTIVNIDQINKSISSMNWKYL